MARIWSNVFSFAESSLEGPSEADAWRAQQQRRRVARALEGQLHDEDLDFAQCAEMVEAERRARSVAGNGGSARHMHDEL